MGRVRRADLKTPAFLALGGGNDGKRAGGAVGGRAPLTRNLAFGSRRSSKFSRLQWISLLLTHSPISSSADPVTPAALRSTGSAFADDDTTQLVALWLHFTEIRCRFASWPPSGLATQGPGYLGPVIIGPNERPCALSVLILQVVLTA